MRAALERTDPSTLLPGGVSSDIRLVEIDGDRYCVKQALPKLKVAADWRAPVERNHSEAEWLRVAARIVPESVPRVIYEDIEAGWFVMEYLPPDNHPVWKSQLRDGVIEPSFAAAVGERLARIHAATAGPNPGTGSLAGMNFNSANDADSGSASNIARTFATDHIFYPIRPEPYLIATGRAHPDLASRLEALSNATMSTKKALVHGDVSPKNILCGPHGPVFLDAECAWYGDPAFDLAFVLNHLLLKGVWRPQWAGRYLECFDALVAAYVSGVDWEPASEVETRTAHLLPGLMLGRIDGKSPVEYITRDQDKALVRRVARELLLHPVASLGDIRWAWAGALDSPTAGGG